MQVRANPNEVEQMEISVIGAGYVGLTTAACLAEIGHHVLCADCDLEKLNSLKAGRLPFYEPHLDDLVKRNVASGRLEFTLPSAAIEKGKAIFICVGTPPLENGEADLSSIESVARLIFRFTTRMGSNSMWCPIPNSCVRDRLSRIFSIPTASS